MTPVDSEVGKSRSLGGINVILTFLSFIIDILPGVDLTLILLNFLKCPLSIFGTFPYKIWGYQDVNL